MAAARQAALYGVPGMAFSLDSLDGSWKYAALARFAAANLARLSALCTHRDDGGVHANTFVNVNAASADTYTEVVYSTLCRRDYRDRVSVVAAPDGRRYGFFVGGDVQSFGDGADDWSAVAGGGIAVSLIRAESVAEPKPEHFSLVL